MSLYNLPTELITDILSLVLEESPIPSNILRVSSTFLAIAQPLLHTHLRFSSSRSLNLFALSSGIRPLACPPNRFTLVLPGGVGYLKLFANLHDAFLRCRRDRDKETGQVALDVLRLQLNSHTTDPNPELVGNSLSLAR